MPPEKRAAVLKKIQRWTRVIQIILLFPCVIFWATLLASFERTPLTGRWRTILLSPEEEDDIAAQLVGEGWYKAVNQVLESEGQPSFIPPSDWRYQWVRETFQRLVAILPTLENEKEQAPNWIDNDTDNPPLPPPACHPLKPRPRAADMIVRGWCEMTRKKTTPRPRDPDNFSLLLVDSPADSNAFSYGFWPNGGSGVVVYSGFLDDIFAKIPLVWETPPDDRPWLTKLFGTTPSPQARPVITQEHTTDLAVLLAHELSHLILAHHLETLSASTVVVPGTIAILADLVRAVIFPITMFFGPFVNDAVAHMGSIGSGELKRMGDWCTTSKQEIEADVVSARILAYAGFDARDAIKFWETRQDHGAECNIVEKDKRKDFNIQHIAGDGHPENAKRIEVLRQELERWEEARRAAALKH
ncbi:hypothetical protein BKA70DRAFT_1371760 [Coprinopsis sp. MPI-PUGE-AT-0042]|nr:hypothetical protein BKA70DRAFT_1371760 [Coprinopsis sp. MPI-PUGE-AT-0042]